ncbi:MAG TPA: bifunctional serine/threonine-protein kinase/formylglycine-generating enzyme family protein [Pyrinomonadaceae bacterium]|nr:bifunctional serine/threonine-protein kinase/formylglycine-generating enzyme family protein [Pyrinomonadaceae bacterium]
MKECPACHRCFPDGVNHCPEDGGALKFLLAGDPVLEGRYRLERKIGHGGMGMVFKARHVFLKTTHAVKVILPDLVGNDPTLTTRFRQEAMAAAAIRHPNTVSVTDYGVLGGTTPYLVMEYVEGRSLHDLLTRERRLPPALAVEIALAVCEGVDAAHRAGIVHRDLKPLNILIREGESPRDGVKVLDFGLAKIKSGELLGSFVAAQTQGLMGSPFYMAPEQWGDEDVDVRADIYSLGVILYQMLAGDVPFAGRSIPSIMNKHLTVAPSPLAERGAEVPPEVERVVRRALEKDPARRQQTVAELMAELREALADLGAAGRLAYVGPQTLPLRPRHEGERPEGRGATTGGSSRPDEGSVRTVAGGRERTSALGGESGGMQTVAGPYASGAQESAAQESAARASAPHEAGAHDLAMSGAPGSGARESGPHDPVTPADPRPQAEHTSPVGRADERPRTPVTRTGTEGLTEPLPPGGDSAGGGVGVHARDEQAQNLAGEGARQVADEAARRAREASARAAEEERRRREAEEVERRRAAEEAERRRRAEDDAAAARERASGAAALPGAAGVGGAASRAGGTATAGAGPEPPAGSVAGPESPAGAVVRPGPSRAPLVAAGAAAVLLSLGGAYFLNSTDPAPPRNENARPTPSPAQSPSTASPTVRADLVSLPGGAFRAGRDDVPALTERAMRERGVYLLWMYQQWPAHPVSVGPFAIDRTEVTNEEYAEFVRQTGHPAPPGLWEGDGRPAEQQLRLPVTQVSHEDAVAFAAWRSLRDGVTYRLPTEQEWEYAARGGGDPARAFPWGREWVEGRANLGGSGPAPVGSFARGDTPQGLTDMIGNVWELTSSEAGMYEGNDRTQLDEADRGSVVARGGSFESRPDGDRPITVTARQWVARDFRSRVLGFRLVRPGR